jgi:hypothetical protein
MVFRPFGIQLVLQEFPLNQHGLRMQEFEIDGSGVAMFYELWVVPAEDVKLTKGEQRTYL